MTRDTVDLLWTGGWDSSFRLFQLLLGEKKQVRPHYLMDPDRPSTILEMRAIRRIKRALHERFPETVELLLPTEYMDVGDIPHDDDVETAFKKILQTHHLGSQYDWLARYCKSKKLPCLEIGLLGTVNRPSSKWFAPPNYSNKPHLAFGRLLVERKTSDSSEIHFDQDLCTVEEYTLFQYFRAPLFKKTKQELGALAKTMGCADLLHYSWFCHRPLAGRWPCGKCNPCADALAEGFAYRVGPIGCTVSMLTRFLGLRKIKHLIKALSGR